MVFNINKQKHFVVQVFVFYISSTSKHKQRLQYLFSEFARIYSKIPNIISKNIFKKLPRNWKTAKFDNNIRTKCIFTFIFKKQSSENERKKVFCYSGHRELKWSLSLSVRQSSKIITLL